VPLTSDGTIPNPYVDGVERNLNRREIMKITELDRGVLRTVRTELERILGEYAETSGLDFDIGSIRFNTSKATIKLEVTLPGGKNEALERDASIYGLTVDPINGKQLTGYSARRRKYPFTYKDLMSGKEYKCGLDYARMYFKKAA
jgi:hypothetical protein